MRVHVIDAANRDRYAAELDAHHQLRHDIYVVERKWQALNGIGGREYDQFDLPDAIYLLAICDSGEVAGGTRLLQSTGPTLLNDVFVELASSTAYERAVDILEWTRFFVAPRFRERGRPCCVGGLVCAAMMEFCLRRGVRTLNAVGETYWFTRSAALGWHPCPLGAPREHDGMSIRAWTIAVTQSALNSTLQFYGLSKAQIAWDQNMRPPAPIMDAVA